MISKGVTTIEWMEKGVSQSEYNKGLKENLTQIFGTEPFLWFLPVFTSIGDGYQFVKTEIAENV
jgi:hypothetical protein